MTDQSQIRIAPWAYVLAVQDVDSTATYFRDMLGFTIDWTGAPDWRLAIRDGVRLMIGRCPTDVPADQIGSHNWFCYLHISDVSAFHAEITANGAVCTAPANKHYGKTIIREIMVRSPDGHRMVFGQVL